MPADKRKTFENLKTKSLLLMPIKRGKVKLGVITIHAFTRNLDYSENDILSMQKFIKQITVFLENAIIVDKLNTHTEKLNAAFNQIQRLGEIGAKLNSSFDIEEILEIILQGLNELFNFDSVSVFLKKENENYLECTKYYNDKIPKEEFKNHEGRKINLNDEKLKIVNSFINKKPIYINNLSEVTKDKLYFVIMPKSVLVAPLIVLGDVIGVITMTSIDNTLDLKTRDINMVLTFAEQIASAINNSRLYTRAEEREKVIRRTLSELEKLQKVSQLVNSTLDIDKVFNLIVDELLKLYYFEGFSLLLINEEKNTYNVRKYYSKVPLTQGLINEDYDFPLDVNKGGRVAQAMIENKIFYFNDTEDIKKFTSSINKKFKEKLGLKSLLIMPIEISGKVIGSINMFNFTGSLNLTDYDIDTIKRFTSQIAHAVHNSKLYETISKSNELLTQKNKIITNDLIISERIQKAILGKEYVNIEDLDIYLKYKPMHMVGGDFYDITKITNSSFRIFIADMTGHGVQAALLTMLLRAEYDKIKKTVQAPHELLATLNKNYINNYNSLDFFFTGFILDIYLTSKKVVYSTCGHPEQILIKNNENKIEKIKSGGKLMGLLIDSEFSQESFDYEEGDKIVLFTDGLFEEFNEKDVCFGEKRLHKVIEQNKHLPSKKLHEKIYDEMCDFIGDAEVNDDILLLTIELK